MSCLYILAINPLMVNLLANIFSHSVWFFVVHDYLCCAKAFKFMCFFFLFIFIILGGGLKKILLQFMSVSVLPFFSSKSFIVSSLIFRSLIHFEFIFVYGVRDCCNFILLHVAVKFSCHHLLNRLFLHYILKTFFVID